MNISVIGIDLAKEIFQIYAIDNKGNKVLEKRLKRVGLLKFIAKQQQCVIVMEACGSSNYWARKFNNLGHTVKLIAPQYVKPFVKGNKNDSNDAHAIVEAYSRPDMPYVQPKTVEQQDWQSLLRIREGYIEIRTKISNQIRGLLAEYGIVIKVGISHVQKELPILIDQNIDNGLSIFIKAMLELQYNMLLKINEQLAAFDIRIANIAKNNTTCQRLQAIEGVGIMTSVAILALVGNGAGFKNGRHFAAMLGLVPRQHSSGNKTRLMGISKRGDNYARKLLVHGGRSVIKNAHKKSDPRSIWINNLVTRIGVNKASVAVANKNARIIMALLLNDTEYKKAA